MVKNRHIVISLGLLLILFVTVIVIVPQLKLASVNPAQAYVENVFDKSKVTSVDVLIDDTDLEDMLTNPLEEKIAMASVVVNGVEVKNVGIRTKGNSSLMSVARDGNTDRYSFKIDFDYYDNEQSLYGLKKLNLNNNFSDSTFMREILSYEMMEDMGVAAPANSYMYVTINGKDWGLYVGVEAIDETFLAENFPEGTGDLYKPDGNDLSYISDDIEDYTGLALKTNVETSNQSAMIEMLDTINHGGNLEDVLDVDEMLRYFAVNTALVSLDSYQGNFMHNYYLYEENGVFSILPWDYNMSFAGFGGGGGPGGGFGTLGVDQEGAPADGPTGGQTGGQGEGKVVGQGGNQPQSNAQAGVIPGANRNGGFDGGGMGMSSDFMSDSNINFSIVSPVSGSSLESRPLLNALLSVEKYREQYNQYLEEIANEYLDEERMLRKTKEISSLIMSYVEKDPTKFSTTEQFVEGVSGEKSLVQFAIKRAESILAQLSGDLVVEADTGFEFGGFGGNMGEPPVDNGGFGGRGGQQPGQDGALPPDMTKMLGRPDRMNGPAGMNGQAGPFGRPGEQGALEQNVIDSEGYSSSAIIMSIIFIVLLIGATIFAALFKRRRG